MISNLLLVCLQILTKLNYGEKESIQHLQKSNPKQAITGLPKISSSLHFFCQDYIYYMFCIPCHIEKGIAKSSNKKKVVL